MLRTLFIAASFCAVGQLLAAEAIPVLPANVAGKVQNSPLSTKILPPTRIVWQSETGVENAKNLLQSKAGQAVLSEPVPPLTLKSTAEHPAGILLDFGVEIAGYVELITPMTPDQGKLRRVRVRFGESVSEAMSEIGGKQNAVNDHAVRDQVVTLPWLGKKIVGPSGFRFVRIDNVDPTLPVQLSEVRAVLQIRDVPYIGSFRCSDERLNRIWDTGAYTVHLNMQEYLWDGVKRDRLVWLGDMHPEVSTINAVFGFNEVVPQSLDLIREVTKPTEWMNGISSYSMWWVIIHEDWYLHHGNREYLEAQKPYMQALLRHLATFVEDNGKEKLNGTRFLDWPTYENKVAVHEGLHAMMLWAMQSGERVMMILNDPETAAICKSTTDKLRKYSPESSGRKSPAALLTLAGARDAKETAASVLKKDGPKDISTFYGFYVLQALAKSGDYDTALDFISTYWGAMLDFGATTFWEDFDLAWTNNAARIDEMVPAGKKDIHGDCGAHCYIGFRHSLCHGWASGPTAWMSQHVLGVQPLEPGMKRVRIVPNLGKLEWAEGTYPTPNGPIQIRHERQKNGAVKSTIKAPKGIVVVEK